MADGAARVVARPMQMLSVIAMPFVWLLSKSTALLVSILGIKDAESKVTEEEIKAIIQEVSGLACGIGPYTPPAEQAAEHPTVEQALKELENHGVDVVYKDKE